MCAKKCSDAAQKKPNDGNTTADPLALLDRLPELSAKHAGQAMLSLLRHLNSTVQPPLQRYQQFAKLNSHIHALILQLEQYHLLSEVAHDDATPATLTRQLLQESANCHNIIINQLAHDDNFSQHKEPLSLSISCAIRFKSRYLMEHYLTYQPNSSDYWGELKRHYRYAQQHQLTNIPLYDKKGIAQTIESAFIAVLLFAAINPFRLKRIDIINSHAILSQWAHHCHFIQCDKNWRSNGDWIIDLASERPPEYRQAGQSKPDSRPILAINITQLLELCNDIGSDELDEHRHLKKQLLERLKYGWESIPPRSYERRSSYKKMDLSLGLQDCNQLLIESKTKRHTKNKNALWSLHLDNRWLKEEITAGSRIIHDIEEIDVGIGGYGLRCSPEYSDRLHKGDLALIRTGIANEAWRVGQVRWIRADDSSITFGVSVLTEDATAFIIATPSSEEDGGLLLPSCNTENPFTHTPFDNSLATLMLPSCYQKGDKLQCITAHGLVKIELKQQLKQGPSYKLFNYHIVE